jgi:YHS domain-containing protein
MIRWIILLFVGYLVYQFLKRFLASSRLPKKNPPEQIQDEMVQDPVCKVYLPKRQALVLNDPKGETQYFCSTECREKFIKNAKQKA